VLKLLKGCLLVWAGVVLLPQSGVAAEYEIGAVPAWVAHVALQIDGNAAADVSGDGAPDGVHYLLSDEQVRVDAAGKEVFRHFASRVASQNGLEQAASLEFGFDPAYQTLTLHSIDVIRNGTVIPKLATATVRVLQREPELESRIFDGRKSANVFLDDVRVGDVVEYAYSLRGSNPVFAGRQFGGLDLAWRVPVGHRFGRLLVPKDRPFNVVHHNTMTEPSLTERGGYADYRWEVRNTPPVRVDDDSPRWYDPYPWVQWSEYADWGEVARWAEPLYRVPEQPSPALQTEVWRIQSAHQYPAERLVAALRFVQDEVRYLGVEIGVGSHAPSAPDLVLQRRFGDCKDKALLLVTLLRALGIDAHPALVNTNLRRSIGEQQPSPAAFNHVLVRASIDGRHYWLDPTRVPQAGTAGTIFQPDYELALVVDAATSHLSSMDGDKAPRLFFKRISTEFDARGGLDKPLVLTVKTVAEGPAAEAQRNFLAANSRDEIQKQYLNYYASYYPGIEVAATFEVADDAEANRLSVTERYRVKDFWVRDDEKKHLQATGHVPDLEDYLRRPRSTIRNDPLAIAHPVDVMATSTWLLPEKWTGGASDERVKDAAFTFEHWVVPQDDGRRIVETDRFVTHASFVRGADAPAYAANLEKARQLLGMTLTKNDAPVAGSAGSGFADRFNWSVALLGALMLAGFVWLATRVYRYDPAPAVGLADPRLCGIAGWLALPAIAIAMQPAVILFSFLKLAPNYAADTWAVVTTAGQAGYHPLWAPTLLFELAANLWMIVFSVLLAILFFRKRRSVPYIFLVFQAGVLAIVALDAMAASMIPALAQADGATWPEVIKRALSVVVWGGYFVKSKRVKATFVNTWRARPRSDERIEPTVGPAMAEQEQEEEQDDQVFPAEADASRIR
jgi:transglutaminase-like putative cysteine protease